MNDVRVLPNPYWLVTAWRTDTTLAIPPFTYYMDTEQEAFAKYGECANPGVGVKIERIEKIAEYPRESSA